MDLFVCFDVVKGFRKGEKVSWIFCCELIDLIIDGVYLFNVGYWFIWFFVVIYVFFVRVVLCVCNIYYIKLIKCILLLFCWLMRERERDVVCWKLDSIMNMEKEENRSEVKFKFWK